MGLGQAESRGDSSLLYVLQQIANGGDLYSQICFHKERVKEHETLARMHKQELQKLEKLQERTNEAARILQKED